MKQNTQLPFILFWVAICLFNFRFLSDRSMQLYVFFTLFTLAFAGIIIFKTIRHKVANNILSPWLMGCLVWMLYAFANSFFRAETDWYYIIYLVASVCFVFALIIYFRNGHKLVDIYKYLVALGVLESIVVFLQYFKITDVSGIYSITGTFHNPNVTAIYITICTAFYFGKISESPKKWNNYVLLGVLLLAIALTSCRTAYLGVLTIAGVYIFLNPNIKIIIQKSKPKVKYWASTLLISLFVLASVHLYQTKQQSADGRLFVWKISMSMVKEKPILGYGYGFFDKNYNLKQADYFAQNKGTENEIQNARYIYMPYNDYLENLVYGGIIGLGFYLFFWIIPIIYAAKQSNHTALSILLAVAVMSTTNFIFQSVPVWIVVLIMIAHSISQIKFKPLKMPAKVIYSLLFITTIVLLQMALKHAYGQTMLTSARQSLKNRNLTKAHTDFEKGVSSIGPNGEFYGLYADFLFREKRPLDAQKQASIAKKYSSNPEILINMALCNFREQNLKEAERNLLLAKFMVPAYFKAKLALLQLYDKTNQSQKAITIANEILAQPFNSNNKDALNARKLAELILKQRVP
jgi:O-antigen ligase